MKTLLTIVGLAAASLSVVAVHKSLPAGERSVTARANAPGQGRKLPDSVQPSRRTLTTTEIPQEAGASSVSLPTESTGREHAKGSSNEQVLLLEARVAALESLVASMQREGRRAQAPPQVDSLALLEDASENDFEAALDELELAWGNEASDAERTHVVENLLRQPLAAGELGDTDIVSIDCTLSHCRVEFAHAGAADRDLMSEHIPFLLPSGSVSVVQRDEAHELESQGVESASVVFVRLGAEV